MLNLGEVEQSLRCDTGGMLEVVRVCTSFTGISTCLFSTAIAYWNDIFS